MNKIVAFCENPKVFHEKSEHTLKELSSIPNIDMSVLAKIGKDERNSSKHLCKKILENFKVNERMFLSTILSDQMFYDSFDENAYIPILRTAEEKVSYIKSIKN